MKQKPLVSVLMPNYNCEKYLDEAINSVLKQTYTNFELIIIDDASTDSSWRIIQKQAKRDKRIKAYKNDKNMGRAKTYNKALNLLSNNTKYFFFIGSDDLIKKELIEQKVKILEKRKDLDGLGSSIDYVTENLKFIKRRDYPKTNDEIKKSFLLFSPFSQGGMILREHLKREKFNEKFKVSLDYEMWGRLISKGYKFENLQESLYLYRQFPEQAKQKNLKLTIKNTIKIKSKYLFKPKFFNLKAFFRLIMEMILFLLPKKFVLWLFYKLK